MAYRFPVSCICTFARSGSYEDMYGTRAEALAVPAKLAGGHVCVVTRYNGASQAFRNNLGSFNPITSDTSVTRGEWAFDRSAELKIQHSPGLPRYDVDNANLAIRHNGPRPRSPPVTSGDPHCS